MLSPHAVARVRSLFTMAVDADRARRAAGLPESDSWYERGAPPPWPVPRSRTLLQELRPKVRAVVQSHVFTGG